MVHGDTVRLLRECSSGINMGVSSIGEVLPSVKDKRLREILCESREKHRLLGDEADRLISEYGDEEKDAPAMARGMAKLKSDLTLSFSGNPKDSAVASLITDGCNMGVKSLSRYLNEFAAADERSKDIAKRLISLEERLSVDLRDWL